MCGTIEVSRSIYDAMLDAEHRRWELYSDLGASLHAMRQLGHWRPFTRSSRKMFARIVGDAIAAHAPEQHQQSRRVGPPVQETVNASRHLW